MPELRFLNDRNKKVDSLESKTVKAETIQADKIMIQGEEVLTPSMLPVMTEEDIEEVLKIFDEK